MPARGSERLDGMAVGPLGADGAGASPALSWIADGTGLSVEPQLREAPVFTERTSVGLDVHARSIVGCGLDTVTGEVLQARLVPDAAAVSGVVAELPGRWRWPTRLVRPGSGWPGT